MMHPVFKEKEPISKATLERFFANITKDPSGCWYWKAGLTKKGYGQFIVNYGTYRINHRAHKFMMMLMVGKIQSGKVIMHTCDTPKCVNPTHLKIATQAENIRDSVNKGRWLCRNTNPCKGMKNAAAKLTEKQVEEIKKAYRAGVKGLRQELAKKYGVNKNTIFNIGTGRTWKNQTLFSINKCQGIANAR